LSLTQLQTIRRAGRKPQGINVLIGKPPAWFEDSPSQVVVDRPGMDLSPLVGLRVHILDLQADPDFTLWVLRELERLKVDPAGFCGLAGTQGASPEHEYAMNHFRELLCTA
jgi:hypothetical protein